MKKLAICCLIAVLALCEKGMCNEDVSTEETEMEFNAIPEELEVEDVVYIGNASNRIDAEAIRYVFFRNVADEAITVDATAVVIDPSGRKISADDDTWWILESGMEGRAEFILPHYTDDCTIEYSYRARRFDNPVTSHFFENVKYTIDDLGGYLIVDGVNESEKSFLSLQFKVLFLSGNEVVTTGFGMVSTVTPGTAFTLEITPRDEGVEYEEYRVVLTGS